VPRASEVNIAVYNVLGQRVSVLVDAQRAAGTYSVDFQADRFASGVYFYVLKADDVHLVQKMILVK
jgi:hypothetical protein